MKIKGYVLVVLLSAIFFTSCLTTSQTNLLREPGGDIPHYFEVKGIPEYTIKPGDELYVTITLPEEDVKTRALFSLFTNANYSSNDANSKLRTMPVSPEGTIYFPYVGDIKVEGKTTHEVEQLLEKTLTSNDPERPSLMAEGTCYIRVTLGNRFFSVIGESGVGQYRIAKEQMTIYQALAMSGDVNPYGDRKTVRILRPTVNGTIEKQFDLRSADVVNSEFYYVQPNDVIYIQPMNRQFWGINSFGAVFAVTSTIISFGLMVYNIIK